MVSRGTRALILWLWIPSVLAGGIMTLELLLQLRSAAIERWRPDRTALDRLRRAYLPFTIKHLHPQYLFFFPLDAAERVALGNGVCSLDADGFREPGPASAAGRKLAVLLGGSAAFGHFASSNDTTITSYLNRLQDEYFFVNAGVPSWNSSQELMRMAFQIADLHPSLVIAFDGLNDAALMDLGVEAGRHYPAGTPESFDELETLIDEARRPWSRVTWPRLFPEITNRIEKYTAAADDGPGAPMDPVLVAAAARRYAGNLAAMAALSRDAGARFIAVFQPVAGLHHHLTPPADASTVLDVAAFRDAAIAALPSGVALQDFSSILDADFASVPIADPDLRDDTLFVDDAHLTDRGNAAVARHLLALIDGPR